MKCYEEDRVQCQGVRQDGKRCTCIGTHSDGGNVYCERHMQIARRDRANAVPIKEAQRAKP